MAEIVFDRVTKRYDDGQIAVNALDLTIADGEFLVLVGPSGCGKSTALRMIAGLEEISDGELRIDGELANDLAPRERNIAMVFQSYALYPHLTVAENIGFGLKVRGADKAEIDRKVRETAELLELGDYLARKPGKLSGGQRQRVAMGRALVRSPKAYLMDEPLSNLDARLRGQMRAEIARLQKMTGVTTIYVTHDQVEAMTMGDRVAVMNKGVLQQLAEPRRLYDAPANLFVAGFIGSPPMNLLAGTVGSADGGPALRLGQVTVPLDAAALAERPALAASDGRAVVAGIRPEALQIAEDDPSAPGRLCGRVAFVEDLGASLLVHVDLDAGAVVASDVTSEGDEMSSARTRLRAVLDGTLAVKSGQRIGLTVEAARVHVFDAKTEAAIRS
ncbi:sn-glycerol-3-phosphate ABC transporter ATP-binding protein UgpC [Kaistia geumhonensis]|uniref:Multiple sugar transport system ATP-binding protein n=1 Tax=Kaistia geumhonensis TaxID=410839 RepID=A0ABU0MBS4_9HYPH|nr:sn-glycerol-3-phosphate ABC transporter ATP-binding protein UgpC [Kaistia geumhonensis]MCX5481357.1 sn-glycerol-3-phosphate ABC transporter ATP-binding protein UgpC [Kaistia geumhonensis]MDQ0518419.1 multiple sugar transport system ATP-binding protein [Kaistia geumhonensis]